MRHRRQGPGFDFLQSVLVQNQNSHIRAVFKRVPVEGGQLVSAQLKVPYGSGKTLRYVDQTTLGDVNIGEELRVEVELTQMSDGVALQHEVHESLLDEESPAVDVADQVVVQP